MHTMEVSHLTRDYGQGKGIFDLSFSIAPGEVFGFLGPNGAGKTTTIRHLMGFLRPRQGSCTIDGMDCWKDAARIQKNLGYIPGEIAFFGDMDGWEYLTFLQKYRGMSGGNRMMELIARFEVNPKGKIKKMSKGMKQKIGIVAAFMHDPAILILDEPTSGLDPLMQGRFVELIQEEKAAGKTILMSSHMFEEVERTCDRIGIIRSGKLVALDSASALGAKHRRRYTVTLAAPQEAADFAQAFGGELNRLNPCQVTLTQKQTLEDIFLHYYAEEDRP